MCNSDLDSTRPSESDADRYEDPHTSRFRQAFAGSATLISTDELVLTAQNVRAGAAAATVVAFRSWPRRTAGQGLGSLSSSATRSTSLLWRPARRTRSSRCPSPSLGEGQHLRAQLLVRPGIAEHDPLGQDRQLDLRPLQVRARRETAEGANRRAM